MAIICWGSLAKSADDTTRVEQSIHHYVQTHDENPNAHMGADYSLGGHRLQVELDHPPNSVNYFHVKDIHAESITAGGLVVKGKGPYISVQDAVGAERVKIYPEGIIVKDGLISVQNDEEQVIIDKKGLWGSNISYSSQVTKTEGTDLAGDSEWYNLPPLSHGVYLSKESPCLIFGNLGWVLSGKDADIEIRCYYPTGYMPAGSTWRGVNFIDASKLGVTSFMYLFKLIPGFNTIALQAMKNTPDESASIEGPNAPSFFGYMILGN